MIFRAAKIHYIWMNMFNGELYTFGELDPVYFIRTNRLKRIGHINRMDADIIPKSIFNSQSEGNGLSVSRFRTR